MAEHHTAPRAHRAHPSRDPDPKVGDHAPLLAWLDKHRARFLWRVGDDQRSRDARAPVVEGWRVGAAVAIVVLYRTSPATSGEASGGWGIATEADTIDTAKTIEDAEKRLGLAAPTPTKEG